MINSPFWQNLFRPAHKQMQHICELWSQTPIFSGLTSMQCRALVANMPLRNYEAGEPIFKQGEVGIGACLILKGDVHICSGDKVLAAIEHGDFFGEVALVIEAPRTATAVAKSDVQIVFFLRPQLERLLSQSPRLGAKLMQNLARVMAGRLGSTNALLEAHHVAD